MVKTCLLDFTLNDPISSRFTARGGHTNFQGTHKLHNVGSYSDSDVQRRHPSHGGARGAEPELLPRIPCYAIVTAFRVGQASRPGKRENYYACRPV